MGASLTRERGFAGVVLGAGASGPTGFLYRLAFDHMPMFDYDNLLWGERQIRSVANMTRKDAQDFLAIAHSLNIRPEVTVFALRDANEALLAVKEETAHGSVVIVP